MAMEWSLDWGPSLGEDVVEVEADTAAVAGAAAGGAAAGGAAAEAQASAEAEAAAEVGAAAEAGAAAGVGAAAEVEAAAPVEVARRQSSCSRIPGSVAGSIMVGKMPSRGDGLTPPPELVLGAMEQAAARRVGSQLHRLACRTVNLNGDGGSTEDPAAGGGGSGGGGSGGGGGGSDAPISSAASSASTRSHGGGGGGSGSGGRGRGRGGGGGSSITGGCRGASRALDECGVTLGFSEVKVVGTGCARQSNALVH